MFDFYSRHNVEIWTYDGFLLLTLQLQILTRHTGIAIYCSNGKLNECYRTLCVRVGLALGRFFWARHVGETVGCNYVNKVLTRYKLQTFPYTIDTKQVTILRTC